MNAVIDDKFIKTLEKLEDDETKSPIKEYLKDKTIFLTGGFGFVGKLLIAKLLICDVKKIYLFVRGKKELTAEDRLQKLKKEPIFEKLLRDRPNPFSRLGLITGNLNEVGLGISNEEVAVLTNEVEIVFHAAADVRFDESLKEAVETNVRGTREIMLLSQKIINLNVFVYVSTAFCTPGFNVRESFYKTTLDPDFMIKLVESLRPNEYDDFEPVARRIIQPYPNTYTYSKALSEQIVRKYGSNLNIAVIRPSIISTTYNDPLPGYTDNIYGINGIVTGAGVGVLRILHINKKLKANIVPADYVVNSILALAWLTVFEQNSNFVKRPDDHVNDFTSNKKLNHDNSNESIKIYHCTASNSNSLTWADVREYSIGWGLKNPSKKGLWIICYNTTKHYYIFQFLKIFYHFLPALIVDTFLVYSNKKPKLLKIYRKVNKFSDVLRFFTTNEWNFESDNMKHLCGALSQHDRKYFQCNTEEIEWEDFMRVFSAGLRRFIVGESLDTIDEGRKRYRRMKMLHYLLMTLIYAFLAFFAFKILKFYSIVDYGVDIINWTNTTFVKHNRI